MLPTQKLHTLTGQRSCPEGLTRRLLERASLGPPAPPRSQRQAEPTAEAPVAAPFARAVISYMHLSGTDSEPDTEPASVGMLLSQCSLPPSPNERVHTNEYVTISLGNLAHLSFIKFHLFSPRICNPCLSPGIYPAGDHTAGDHTALSFCYTPSPW